MKQIYTTTLRLNLEKEADREAWEHLRRVDRKQYHSVNSAVIAAVNAYFSRKEQLEADPYLETREKEDAFLEKVMETLQEGLRQATVPGLVPLLQLLQGAQAGTPAPAKEPGQHRDGLGCGIGLCRELLISIHIIYDSSTVIRVSRFTTSLIF